MKKIEIIFSKTSSTLTHHIYLILVYCTSLIVFIFDLQLISDIKLITTNPKIQDLLQFFDQAKNIKCIKGQMWFYETTNLCDQILYNQNLVYLIKE